MGTALSGLSGLSAVCGGAAAWDPSSVPGLYEDWRATDIASIGAGWTGRVAGRLFNSTTAAPTLADNVIGTKPGVRFDGVDDHWRSQSFALPQPFTVYTVAVHSPGGGRFYDGNTVNEAVLIGASTAGTTTPYGMYGGSAVAPDAVRGALVADVFCSVWNGASSSLTCGRRAIVTGNPGTNGFTGGMLIGGAGNLAGGFFAGYDLCHLLLYSQAHDATQRAAVLAGLASLWPLPKPSIRFAGDSNTADGVPYTSAGMNYPNQLLALLPGGSAGWDYYNGGSAGTTIQSAASGHTLSYGRYVSRLRQNVHVIMYGTNDILAGRTAAQVYADLKTWWADAMASGATLVVIDLFDRDNWSAGQRAEAVALNALIASDTSLYHALVQVSADNRFVMQGPPTAATADGIHMNDTSAGWLAGLVADAITPLL